MQPATKARAFEPRDRSASRNAQVGLIWRRSDFRESSRLITLVTPDRGRLTTLGKGAYRTASQCLGRIDFLNLVEVKLSAGNLPVLHRVKLHGLHRRGGGAAGCAGGATPRLSHVLLLADLRLATLRRSTGHHHRSRAR